MTRKLRVGIIFGGKSVEHEVSIQSAKNVFQALDKTKYEPVLIGIDKLGTWHLSASDTLTDQTQSITIGETGSQVVLLPAHDQQNLMHVQAPDLRSSLDVVFPVLHGHHGEDGTIQGLLKLLNIPFVGASVLGSAIGMDKEVAKRLLQAAGIPIAPYLLFTSLEKAQSSFEKISETLGLPFFVKPSNSGSSVGISKVKNEQDFKEAVQKAFSYDRKVLFEKYIPGREIELAVLGTDPLAVSLPGEIVPHHEFYSYEAKYLDENGATLVYPTELDPLITKTLQDTALKAFEVLCCEMMARVDFFVTAEGECFLNEINTIPGFTKISMYPKLWEVSGIGYTQLIDHLITLALERHALESRLLTSYSEELTQKES